VRDLDVRCVACGRSRPPFGQTALNLAGRPSRLGGSIARGLGYTVGSFALALSAFVGWLLHLIFPQGSVSYLVAGPMAVVGLALATLLVRGGSSLRQQGERAENEAKERAVWALAARAGGSVTAPEVARALGVPTPAADAFLTAWAERDVDQIRVEVDDRGRLLYQFPALLPLQPAHARVATPAPQGVRVASAAAPRQRVATDAALEAAAEAEALAEAEGRRRASS
jgi:hypothetical protein